MTPEARQTLSEATQAAKDARTPQEWRKALWRLLRAVWGLLSVSDRDGFLGGIDYMAGSTFDPAIAKASRDQVERLQLAARLDDILPLLDKDQRGIAEGCIRAGARMSDKQQAIAERMIREARRPDMDGPLLEAAE